MGSSLKNWVIFQIAVNLKVAIDTVVSFIFTYFELGQSKDVVKLKLGSNKAPQKSFLGCT